MMTTLLYFVIAAVVIGLVAYVVLLLWDWLCGLIGVPAPIPQVVRVIIIVVAVVAILYRLVPLVSHL